MVVTVSRWPVPVSGPVSHRPAEAGAGDLPVNLEVAGAGAGAGESR